MVGATLALVVGMAVGQISSDASDEPARAIPAPFAPFEHLIGGWKGTGIPTANRVKGWPERHLWAWKFADGRPTAMSLTTEGSKILAKGQLDYDPATKRYRLQGTDPSDKPITFLGQLDASRKALALDRIEPGSKDRLTIRLNSNMIRYTMWLDRQEPGAPQFSRVIEMNLGKEGEAFAAGASAADLPKCIVTGGAATMSVTHDGKSYPLCCTGCRDEFLEHPAKYVRKALLRAQAAGTPNRKTTSATGLRKDDGAFSGLVDDPPPAKPAAQPAPTKPDAKSKPDAKAKSDEPKPEPAAPAAKPPSGNDSATKAAALLRSGQSLEKLGKPSAALDYYRQIVSKFPNTPQAKAAAERIKVLMK